MSKVAVMAPEIPGFRRIWILDTPFLLSTETIAQMETLQDCLNDAGDSNTPVVLDGDAEEFAMAVNWVTKKCKPQPSQELHDLLRYWGVQDVPEPLPKPVQKNKERWELNVPYSSTPQARVERMWRNFEPESVTLIFFDGCVEILREELSYSANLREFPDNEKEIHVRAYGAQQAAAMLAKGQRFDWPEWFKTHRTRYFSR